METISTEVVEDKSLRDTRGRRIMDAQQREELLARYRASGLTQKAFTRREGVNFHTLCAWLAKHRHGRGASVCTAPVARAEGAFIEVRTPQALGPAPLEVALRDGRVAMRARKPKSTSPSSRRTCESNLWAIPEKWGECKADWIGC